MLRNYLLITVRTLRRNFIYSTINITGLAVGLACSALILLWVSDELSYDKFHKHSEKIYVVGTNQVINGQIETTFNAPFPMMDALKTSSAVEHTSLVKMPEGFLLSNNDTRISKMGIVAVGDFLEMFSFNVIAGDPKTALQDPSSAVLTRSTAIALFGSEDVVDKIFTIEANDELRVSAIVEDVPKNSSLQFDFILSSAYYEATQPWYKRTMSNWENHSFTIFAELQEGSNLEDVNKQISSLQRDNNKYAPSAENFLYPLKQWHLYGEFKNGKATGGMIEYVRLFTLIGIAVLVIACINFTNLATARSQGRAREVGIRKSVGSLRKQLIAQFIGESLVITAISFLIALALIQVILPFYNVMVGKNLSLDFSNPALYGAAAAIIIITSLMAGAYPAFYLSSFKPVKVLKGVVKEPGSSATARKILVTLQFGFSIFLVVGSIVIYQQIMFVKARHVGYNRENLLLIWTNDQREKNYSSIKQELLASGLVESVTKSSAPITRIFTTTDGVSWPGKVGEEKVSFVTIATEYDFAKTIGMIFLEGRDFSPEVGSDTSAIIINNRRSRLWG